MILKIKKILQKNNIYQSWDEFVKSVKFNIWSFSQEYVDKTIASMPRKIKDIIKHKGKRTKY